MAAVPDEAIPPGPPTNVLCAFARALNAIQPVAKTQTADTGKYSYRYADLGDVLEECKRACQMFDLAITQSVSLNEGSLALSTMVIHAGTGENVSFPALMMKMPADAQALGSAITYARRYSLLAIFGIAPEDDDGREATRAQRRLEENVATGSRTGAEGRIREMLAELPVDDRNLIVRAFKEEFRMGLTDLPPGRHGDALQFVIEAVGNLGELREAEAAQAAAEAPQTEDASPAGGSDGADGGAAAAAPPRTRRKAEPTPEQPPLNGGSDG